ncbi:NAD(P)/FAD-dependent oxidoreductase [uncultured Dubosiella sp.]|uniref:NAD(P)/FAD-dependent oxidoreductase n=3 Tax=uncultured Dubosiella sp. TaxID=1937011 RepID=UPI002609A359|nr:NAD(P)/FAD-dependent oxidoreductase [uncultured Dubosiella sp.]
MEKFNVAIVGAGPGGIFAAYELHKLAPSLSVVVIEKGKPLEKRKCPIDGVKIKSCINCPSCSIMNGFGGAGAFSDGKYNITNEFGGDLYQYVGAKQAIELMEYVDTINVENGGAASRLFANDRPDIAKLCLQNDLHLLKAKVRHLGTDINYVVLENLFNALKDHVKFVFDTEIDTIEKGEDVFVLTGKDLSVCADQVIVSTGRSGSKWMEKICDSLHIPTESSRIDIGVRVEVPYDIFSDMTDALYESKIVYRTRRYQDKVRTFCMNPHGVVVSENTNGIITVNGHSYEDPARYTDNTNFALLVSNHFTEPFHQSNQYGESIARLSNMLGGGVIVQRFGDLIRGQRSTQERIAKGFVTPTLQATPGDLSLVIPKRQLDDIIEMIEALDRVCPGMASDDTLLYGIEVKFYNMQVAVDEDLETCVKGLYVIGDCSGVTHSLSHASASGVYAARRIVEKL